MKYYYKHSDKSQRRHDIINGEIPKPIRLFPETKKITEDFETNPTSDWWGVYRIGTFSTEFADFDSIEEAENEFYATESEDIYSYVHDC